MFGNNSFANFLTHKLKYVDTFSTNLFNDQPYRITCFVNFAFCDLNIHAAAQCSAENSNEEPGTACQCEDGFKGQITWNGHIQSGNCTATKCTDFGEFAHGTVSKTEEDRHGSVATFACEAGYTLTGSESITCDAPSADAQWPQAPECIGVLFKVALNVPSDLLNRSDEITHESLQNSLTRDYSNYLN